MTIDRSPSRSIAYGLAVLVVAGAVGLTLAGTAIAKGPPDDNGHGHGNPHASVQPSGSPAVSPGHGAQKLVLYLESAFTCTTTPAPARGSKSYGFAILNSTANGMLNVTVSLKKAEPNATFTVTVDQGTGGCATTTSAAPSASPGASPSASPGAAVAPAVTVRTNGKGNGTTHVRVPIVPGATVFSVTVVTADQTLQTKDARIFAKKPGPPSSGSPAASPSAAPSASPSA